MSSTWGDLRRRVWIGEWQPAIWLVRRNAMTDTSSADSSGWKISEEAREEEQVSDHRALARARYESAGWVTFAATMLAVIGAFQAIVGLTAIFRSGIYPVGGDRLVVSVDYTAWGWTHLIVGLVAIAAAIGLRRNQTWARIVGVVIALVSAVTNLAFLPAYPFASSMVITLDVVAIYAIVVHGAAVERAGY